MKVLAINSVPGHRDIVGVASPYPPDDPDAHRLTLRTSKDPDDLDATWLLAAILESIAPVIAEDGWTAALRRIRPEDWCSPTATLVLIEDPGNVLGPGLSQVEERRLLR